MEKAKGVNWDLTFLYDSLRDKKIKEDLEKAKQLADKFEEKYRGRIAAESLTPAVLETALKDIEKVYSLMIKTRSFSHLRFAENTGNMDAQSLLLNLQKEGAEIQNKLVFFNLELLDIPDETFKSLVDSKQLASYKYWLLNLRKWKPYKLSEKEEQIINIKDITGKNANVQLHDEYTASFKFPIEIEGEVKTPTESEVVALFSSDDRDLRKRAFDSFFDVFGENSLVLASIFNTLINDHFLECKRRGIEDVMETAYIRDNVSKELIDTLMGVVRDNYPLVQRYYKLKAGLLNLKKLEGYDRLAPVAKEVKIPFEDGKKMVVNAYTDFDGEFGTRIERFFDEKWIDAEIRPKKESGAFCAGILPELHPAVLANYNDRLEDVFTIAHELGHGVHDLYAGEVQSLLTYHPPLVLAETASIFGEMLLTDKLIKEANTDELKKKVLARQLEDVFNTVSRQVMYVLFEKEAHGISRKRKLSKEELSELWGKFEGELYGDSINPHPKQNYYWARVGHFFFENFYCYAYAFGQLFVLGLYRQYLNKGEDFIPLYKDLLRAGGQFPPAIVGKNIGIDLTKPDFWHGGFDYVKNLIDELEKLA
ncbi:hypothetical protein CH333_01840 [candidate division WOR-3 bacterium JGI_Cruoil_03_44_89]|uniref:Oligoendopeptidase F n=1 Tax=candidate division WOR-3 bacterium JGI_Cruoil_03_44_89 TaxID=1973748 RepID=A0A235BXZ3_UNCW3|nr:MAG: hypothetical protein CH333_01840 [candidate division WOR-3 bacterium JGI_Cruoil_03_44_89]